jgi:hypothetical protein
MSVVTIAFWGIAFSSSRSARRGAIGAPPAEDMPLSSSSQAAFWRLTSSNRAARLSWPASGWFCSRVDHVAPATGQEKETLCVQSSYVSRMQPSIAKHGAGYLRIVPVAQHHIRATNAHFTGFVRRRD